jgi:hypothetical protein
MIIRKFRLTHYLNFVRLAKPVRCNHTTRVVMHRLSKQLIVLLLAVFVTVGMSLSVVQASNMSIKMMDMASSMGKSGGGSCNDCGGPGDTSSMAACAASGCVAPVAAHFPSVEVLDMASTAIHHLHLDVSLLGLDSRPDPYPPRTSHIG